MANKVSAQTVGGPSPIGPSTRYQGSKRKLLPWLLSILDSVPFTSVADIMSGSASLAYAMKRRGKKVIANDYLSFNYYTALAFIENPGIGFAAEDIIWLVTRHPATVAYQDFVEQTFGEMYFTAAENAWLDQTVANIGQLSQRHDSRTGRYKAAIAYHALVQAALAKRPFNLFHRKNLYLRQASVPRSFGNKTTWETPFPELFTRFLNEANEYVFDNDRHNLALNVDAVHLGCLPVDLVYLDPPYFAPKRERARSNYRLLYHFAEGLVQYSNWPKMVVSVHPLKILSQEQHSSNELFTCPIPEVETRYLIWLANVLAQWPNARIAISYKHPGVPTIGSLRQMLVDTGRIVRIEALRYKYALSKKNGRPRENIEVLLVGT